MFTSVIKVFMALLIVSRLILIKTRFLLTPSLSFFTNHHHHQQHHHFTVQDWPARQALGASLKEGTAALIMY